MKKGIRNSAELSLAFLSVGQALRGQALDDALGKQGRQRLLSEFSGRVFRGRSDFTAGEKQPVLTLDIPRPLAPLAHTLTRGQASGFGVSRGRGGPRVCANVCVSREAPLALTWEMTSLKEDLNSCTSVVSRLTSCPVFLASKNAMSWLGPQVERRETRRQGEAPPQDTPPGPRAPPPTGAGCRKAPFEGPRPCARRYGTVAPGTRRSAGPAREARLSGMPGAPRRGGGPPAPPPAVPAGRRGGAGGC